MCRAVILISGNRAEAVPEVFLQPEPDRAGTGAEDLPQVDDCQADPG